ncbi:uncharacterized protein LOC108135537 [Drosophila elegans]|uniref:uncharacterized protein LOC108135537 n=1 Tax=Drosophila elegans TaxID=30023 RepID=UPI0007E63090|nr:uncharacterized protein LOC108135537 [Drosophila elegans]
MGNLKKLIGLPLEVHDLIFELLGNVEYKLNLARVDKVLAAAFKYHSRYDFECLNVEEVPFRLWGALLPLCGSTIRHIETKNDEDISPPYKLIELYCQNLESVGFYINSRNRGTVGKFIRNMPNLKEISVDLKNASPKLLRFIKDLPDLEEIYLYNELSPELSIYEGAMGTWLDNNKYPTFLPKPVNLHDTFSSLKKLRFLALSGFNLCSQKTNDEVNFPALEVLLLDCCAIFSDIPVMPKLKTLGVYSLETIDSSNYNWISKNVNHLECLAICFDHPNVLDVVRRCSNLKILIIVFPAENRDLFKAYYETLTDVPEVSDQMLSEISHIVIRNYDGKRTVTFFTEEFE